MECPHCGDPVTWLDPPFFLAGSLRNVWGGVKLLGVNPASLGSAWSVRWQGGRPSPRELAAASETAPACPR